MVTLLLLACSIIYCMRTTNTSSIPVEQMNNSSNTYWTPSEELIDSSYAFDLVVYGATPAGIAASLAAADAGLNRIALLEPTYQIGGMMTQGGIGMKDHHTVELFGSKGSSVRDWINLNSQYYNTSDPVFQPDNYVGLKNLWTLLRDRTAITVFLNTSLLEAPRAVKKKGTRIEKILTASSSRRQTVTSWSANVFIDATYEGDLMVASGASWTFGREAKDKYNESLGGATDRSVGNFPLNVSVTWPNGTLIPGVDHASALAPVGAADDRVMGYSYRLCITKRTSNKAQFPSPETGDLDYYPQDFELLRRYYNEMASANKTVKYKPYEEESYSGYPPGDKVDVCDDGTDTPITTDEANAARGYPNGSWVIRNQIAKQHKYYVAGLFHFLRTDPSVPESMSKEVREWGLCKDEWPENNHWPPQLYVREAGRLVGDKVYSQSDRLPSDKVCRKDSIAVADWSIDIHIMARIGVPDPITGDIFARNEGQTPFDGQYKTFTFELPYYVLLPQRKEVTNLLVPNCPSVSHVVFSAVREEPTLWQLGRASGVAAALVVTTGNLPVQDLPVHWIQAELLRQNAVIHWPDHTLCTS